MIANLLLKDHPESNTRHTEKREIFDDCLLCEERRVKTNIVGIYMKKSYDLVNIIACGCNVSNNHDQLGEEQEIINLIREATVINNAGAD